ncbi:alpha-1,2-mannosidase, putative [Pedobacter steynii]|uniref:Alpha-1,2-mannosidase, putative n=1 Tax=Pedobacter steynii TaxID=430522 RepID=A0A1G9NEI0_9SPHI|nr:GH92 family glycosyl hydrolase [Pedobacter steynii]NQX39325.1 glycoside hydrolase family 92 protein [Pedobacter steynii]SDL84879.1 alpha-1,2-mannosidase, putative [Pedobacter steynii]
MKLRLIILFICLQLSMRGSAQQANLVKYVNTLQGTNSKHELTRGNTYPTTALPFAMHTWTPQTGRNGDGWKYQYFKDKIRGFQQAHQCSSWSRDYAVFSLMPMTDQLVVNENDREAKFSHSNEIAKPNYYKVQFENQISTEISPSERGAHLRFSYPAGKKSFLVLDGYTGISGVKIYPKENKITGFVNNGEGFKEGFKSFFVLLFDQPFKAYGTWENRKNTINADETAAEGLGKGAYLQFKDGVKVQVKTASSYISMEQAELNLSRELGGDKNLEVTKAKAAEVWNKSLSKVMVEGGTEADKATFYSCFFRASIFSRKFYELDANGQPYYFSPYDGKVHPGYMFTDTGFWDTFRAQFPLNTLMHPEMHGRYMQALIDAYKQCGWLPSWSFPSEAGSMIGNHAISLLADAWAKGIRTFDPKEALAAYLHEATNKGPWGPANGRDGWKEYFELGYVPYPKYREATAKTLEYAYDDYCAWTLAKMTGNDFYARIFERQMYNYKNVYDPSTKFMRGKNAEGQWTPKFDPFEWGGPYTEGNAWHYLWSVFQDINGLIDLMGGQQNFTAKLDAVFSEPNTVNVGTYGGMIHEMTEMVMANMGQYAHGNQPIQHLVYLYSYAAQPWKSQFHARNVMSKLYDATENGYPGDEDQGQTSSWYVLSALGFYSVTPGTDQYVIGSPMFKKTTINLENGKRFVIEAPANSEKNVYIKSATLNGIPYTANFIRHSDLMNGGVLKLEMTDQPELSRGLTEADKPFSLSSGTGMTK